MCKFTDLVWWEKWQHINFVSSPCDVIESLYCVYLYGIGSSTGVAHSIHCDRKWCWILFSHLSHVAIFESFPLLFASEPRLTPQCGSGFLALFQLSPFPIKLRAGYDHSLSLHQEEVWAQFLLLQLETHWPAAALATLARVIGAWLESLFMSPP